MSNPKPEHRITAVEKRVATVEGAIEELASDQAEELKAIRQEIKQGHIDIGKALDSHADGLMKEIRTRFDSADQRLTQMKSDITSIKDDVSGLKSDMAAMET